MKLPEYADLEGNINLELIRDDDSYEIYVNGWYLTSTLINDISEQASDILFNKDLT